MSEIKNILCIFSLEFTKIDWSLSVITYWQEFLGDKLQVVNAKNKYFEKTERFLKLELDTANMNIYIQILGSSNGSMHQFLEYGLPDFDGFVYLTPDYSYAYIPAVSDLYKERRREEIEEKMLFFKDFFRTSLRVKPLVVIQIYDENENYILFPELLGKDFRQTVVQNAVYEACTTKEPDRILKIVETYFADTLAD